MWSGRNVGVDVSANINNNWNYEGRKITCTELSYGYVANDKRLLAIIEYDDSQYEQEEIDKMYASIAPWVATKITPTKAVELCNVWYPLQEGDTEAYFSLAEDDFSIIDNRPVEEM